mgnify:CR=1 FL=1
MVLSAEEMRMLQSEPRMDIMLLKNEVSASNQARQLQDTAIMNAIQEIKGDMRCQTGCGTTTVPPPMPEEQGDPEQQMWHEALRRLRELDNDCAHCPDLEKKMQEAEMANQALQKRIEQYESERQLINQQLDKVMMDVEEGGMKVMEERQVELGESINLCGLPNTRCISVDDSGMLFFKSLFLHNREKFEALGAKVLGSHTNFTSIFSRVTNAIGLTTSVEKQDEELQLKQAMAHTSAYLDFSNVEQLEKVKSLGDPRLLFGRKPVKDMNLYAPLDNKKHTVGTDSAALQGLIEYHGVDNAEVLELFTGVSDTVVFIKDKTQNHEYMLIQSQPFVTIREITGAMTFDMNPLFAGRALLAQYLEAKFKDSKDGLEFAFEYSEGDNKLRIVPKVGAESTSAMQDFSVEESAEKMLRGLMLEIQKAGIGPYWKVYKNNHVDQKHQSPVIGDILPKTTWQDFLPYAVRLSDNSLYIVGATESPDVV